MPFAADLIEPPHASILPDTPDPVLFLAVAAASGLVAGFLILRFPCPLLRPLLRGWAGE